MLTDSDLEARALAFVAERYGRGNTPELWARLQDPDGLYFGVTGATTFVGDGGFFVYRVDGSVTHFGSGDLAPVMARRVSEEGTDALTDMAGTVAIVLRARQLDAT